MEPQVLLFESYGAKNDNLITYETKSVKALTAMSYLIFVKISNKNVSWDQKCSFFRSYERKNENSIANMTKNEKAIN